MLSNAKINMPRAKMGRRSFMSRTFQDDWNYGVESREGEPLYLHALGANVLHTREPPVKRDLNPTHPSLGP